MAELQVVKKSEEASEYHGSAPVSRSRLFRIVKNGQICPVNYKYLAENPPEETDALILGRAFHKLVLEPDGFDLEYAVAPQCDRRTKEGKQIYSDFAEAAVGKTVITSDLYETICGMRDAVMSNKYAKALITGGEPETSYYWTDEPTGIECKCRPDILRVIGDKHIIVDLKSTTDASDDAFRRDCMKHGYDLQTAMYKTGVDNFYGTEHSFVFIAVEKTAPYAVNIVEADDLFIKKGQALYRELLGTLAECTKTGEWYGYAGPDELGGIGTLTLPAYLLKDFE